MLGPLARRISDWRSLLEGGIEESMAKRLEMHLRTGRALGSDVFIAALEKQLGTPLSPGQPGRPRKTS